jgi:hypothetical protein
MVVFLSLAKDSFQTGVLHGSCGRDVVVRNEKTVVDTVASAVETTVVGNRFVYVLVLCLVTSRVVVEIDAVTRVLEEPTKYPAPALAIIRRITKKATSSYFMCFTSRLGQIYAYHLIE